MQLRNGYHNGKTGFGVQPQYSHQRNGIKEYSLHAEAIKGTPNYRAVSQEKWAMNRTGPKKQTMWDGVKVQVDTLVTQFIIFKFKLKYYYSIIFKLIGHFQIIFSL